MGIHYGNFGNRNTVRSTYSMSKIFQSKKIHLLKRPQIIAAKYQWTILVITSQLVTGEAEEPPILINKKQVDPQPHSRSCDVITGKTYYGLTCTQNPSQLCICEALAKSWKKLRDCKLSTDFVIINIFIRFLITIKVRLHDF